MLKDLFDKGKCRIGVHAGDWRYAAEGACEQERICVRCRDRTTRLVHDWRVWAPSPHGPCRLERHCARCLLQESKAEHDWTEPRYVREGDCSRIQVCGRCGTEEATHTVHVFDDWTYSSVDRCDQTVSCSRCALGGTGHRLSHDWEGWTSSSFYDAVVCVCRHCGEMVVGQDNGREDPDAADSFNQAYEAVWGLINAPDVPAVRQRIEARQETLLGPVAPLCLAFIADQVLSGDRERERVQHFVTLLERCRTAGIATTFGPAPQATERVGSGGSTASGGAEGRSSPAGPPPAGLQGHWVSTEFLGAGTPVSMMIETHMVLDGDGRFMWWSRPDNREVGRWSASASTLVLTFRDGSRSSWRYQREGSDMIFPDDSRYRFWQRG